VPHLPQIPLLFDLPSATAIVLVALALIGSYVLATTVSRVRELERQNDASRGERDRLREELAGARDQARAIHDVIANVQRGSEGPRFDEMVSEVRVLQNLVAELSRRPDAGEAKRPPPPAGDAGAQAGVSFGGPGPRVITGLDEDQVLDIVRDGLRNNRVDLFVQPIVSLPQRKHRHYECFSRIRAGDGGMVGPDQYLAGAEREGLIGAIDNMLLFRCVQLVRRVQRQKRDTGIFVNISEHSLADTRFFREFVSFVAENRELAPQLIFEFAQAHVARHGAAVMLELERLARLGFRFSMDQVTDLDLDVDGIGGRHFRFLKIDAQRLLENARGGGRRLDMRAFKHALDRNAIDLIVEKIETDPQLLELLDYPIDYGQGFLFGEPRLARAA
jgi:cyclic-di-GMP phosphodiesterase TipF (flagellum assembly factor)